MTRRYFVLPTKTVGRITLSVLVWEELRRQCFMSNFKSGKLLRDFDYEGGQGTVHMNISLTQDPFSVDSIQKTFNVFRVNIEIKISNLYTYTGTSISLY